jgi:hypothetical protein
MLRFASFNSRKIGVFWFQITASFCKKKLIIALVFQEKRKFVRPKFGENRRKL